MVTWPNPSLQVGVQGREARPTAPPQTHGRGRVGEPRAPRPTMFSAPPRSPHPAAFLEDSVSNLCTRRESRRHL